MKRSFLLTALAGTVLLTACGSKNSDNASPNKAFTKSDTVSGDYVQYDENSNASAESYESGEAVSINYKQSEAKAIDTQMLVYSCDMSIDVLDFDTAVDSIHEMIDINNGFIESENYSDGADTGKWQYSASQKWKTLNAVIRVPSANYNKFCKSAEAVGDMRRKSASVENLNSEYSDLKTTLSIYEAKEQRYLDILAETKNESDALSIENELTNIQIEIAKIKTRMNNIENDVAYSYINLTLNEVREYSEDPIIERTDTFGQRLKNTVKKTWNTFLVFLEGLLFVIIRILPFALLIGLFTFIITKIVKLISRRCEKKRQKRARQLPPPPMPPVNGAPPMNNAPQPPQNNNRPAAGNNSAPPAPNSNNAPNNGANKPQ